MGVIGRIRCARRQRAGLSLRPCLESLEARLALAATYPDAPATADLSSIVIKPTFQVGGSLSTGCARSASGSSGVGILTFGSTTPSGFTPAQIRAAYGVDKIVFGSVAGSGAGQTIAIVDAYDDPRFVNGSAPSFLSSDLARFDQQFGVPDPPSFTKLNEYGGLANLPGADPAAPGNPQGNWELEEALDVEWAHGIAPGASIVLVECNSS
jgi:subtilase family serine protease